MLSRLLLLVCGCSILAGCGYHRTALPDLSRALAPNGFSRQTIPSGGVRLSAPTDWQIGPGAPPLVLALRSGLAWVAVWRYPRSASLPRTRLQFRVALRRLVGKMRARDVTFRLESAGIVPVAHHGAIQVRGIETIDGQPREVRSTHLYVHGAELVLDAFAPPSQFRTVDQLVFHRLLRGLRLLTPAP